MTLETLLMSNLPGASYFESFFGTRVCFYLRHMTYFSMTPLRCSRSAGTLVEPLQAIFFPACRKEVSWQSLAFILEGAAKIKIFGQQANRRLKCPKTFWPSETAFSAILQKYAQAQCYFLDPIQELFNQIHLIY